MRFHVKQAIIAALLRQNRPDLANLIANVVTAKLSVEEALKILGLSAGDFSPSKVKDAYRKAAMENHPDRGGDEAQMKLVNEAYDLLSKLKTYEGPSREDRQSKYEQAAPVVEDYLKKHVNVDVFTKHFEATTGKKFTAKVEDKTDTKGLYGAYVSKNVEWTSDDGQTVFDMRLWVSLSDIVWTKQLGGGGDDFGFKVSVTTAILHNNRKVKFKSRDWESTNRKSILLDPKELFPPAKIEKMMGGKESARKFSRRDMLLALQKRLGAQLSQEWAYIPMGEHFTFVMYRTVFMRMPAWMPHSVTDVNDRKAKWQVKIATVPEADYVIDALVDLKKKAANVGDGPKLVTMINDTFADLQERWRKESQAA